MYKVYLYYKQLKKLKGKNIENFKTNVCIQYNQQLLTLKEYVCYVCNF
jgi:hypothetical protein